jgi:ubiquitin C-terminal hydrolase
VLLKGKRITHFFKEEFDYVLSPHEPKADRGFRRMFEFEDYPGIDADDTVTFCCDFYMQAKHSTDLSSYSNLHSHARTGMVGLENLGATCYLNALLQMLFHVNNFRKAVYGTSFEASNGDGTGNSDTITNDGSGKSSSGSSSSSPASDEGMEALDNKRRITNAIQSTFVQLQTSHYTCTTKKLVEAFGWNSTEAFMQQDVQEMLRLLLDKLEEQMKGTPSENEVKRLFTGSVRTYIKCINVQYESRRNEEFYDLQLDVKGCETLYDSFRKYVKKEVLDGDNRYDAGEEFGKQEAAKGVVFDAFPPVLTLHLVRFAFDPLHMNFRKVHDAVEFPTKLELDEFLAPDCPESSREHPNTYLLHSVLVHSGDVNSGHYYAFIRPSRENARYGHLSGSGPEDDIEELQEGRGGAWFLFDDENVRRVHSRQAIEECYGQDQRSQGVQDRCSHSFSSAYMLVYIREWEAETLMHHMRDTDIPRVILENVERERRSDAQRDFELRAQRLQQRYQFSTEGDLIGYMDFSSGCDFVGEQSSSRQILHTYSKLTLGGMVLQLSQKFGVTPDRIRIWITQKRFDGMCDQAQWEALRCHDLLHPSQTNDTARSNATPNPSVSWSWNNKIDAQEDYFVLFLESVTDENIIEDMNLLKRRIANLLESAENLRDHMQAILTNHFAASKETAKRAVKPIGLGQLSVVSVSLVRKLVQDSLDESLSSLGAAEIDKVQLQMKQSNIELNDILDSFDELRSKARVRMLYRQEDFVNDGAAILFLKVWDPEDNFPGILPGNGLPCCANDTSVTTARTPFKYCGWISFPYDGWANNESVVLSEVIESIKKRFCAAITQGRYDEIADEWDYGAGSQIEMDKCEQLWEGMKVVLVQPPHTDLSPHGSPPRGHSLPALDLKAILQRQGDLPVFPGERHQGSLEASRGDILYLVPPAQENVPRSTSHLGTTEFAASSSSLSSVPTPPAEDMSVLQEFDEIVALSIESASNIANLVSSLASSPSAQGLITYLNNEFKKQTFVLEPWRPLDKLMLRREHAAKALFTPSSSSKQDIQQGSLICGTEGGTDSVEMTGTASVSDMGPAVANAIGSTGAGSLEADSSSSPGTATLCDESSFDPSSSSSSESGALGEGEDENLSSQLCASMDEPAPVLYYRAAAALNVQVSRLRLKLCLYSGKSHRFDTPIPLDTQASIGQITLAFTRHMRTHKGDHCFPYWLKYSISPLPQAPYLCYRRHMQQHHHTMHMHMQHIETTPTTTWPSGRSLVVHLCDARLRHERLRRLSRAEWVAFWQQLRAGAWQEHSWKSMNGSSLSAWATKCCSQEDSSGSGSGRNGGGIMRGSESESDRDSALPPDVLERSPATAAAFLGLPSSECLFLLRASPWQVVVKMGSTATISTLARAVARQTGVLEAMVQGQRARLTGRLGRSEMESGHFTVHAEDERGGDKYTPENRSEDAPGDTEKEKEEDKEDVRLCGAAAGTSYPLTLRSAYLRPNSSSEDAGEGEGEGRALGTTSSPCVPAVSITASTSKPPAFPQEGLESGLGTGEGVQGGTASLSSLPLSLKEAELDTMAALAQLPSDLQWSSCAQVDLAPLSLLVFLLCKPLISPSSGENGYGHGTIGQMLHCPSPAQFHQSIRFVWSSEIPCAQQPPSWLEGGPQAQQDGELGVQLVTAEDRLWLAGRHPSGVPSIPIEVVNFAMGTPAAPPRLVDAPQAGPFMSYIRENDSIDSLTSRIAELSGDDQLPSEPPRERSGEIDTPAVPAAVPPPPPATTPHKTPSPILEIGSGRHLRLALLTGEPCHAHFLETLLTNGIYNGSRAATSMSVLGSGDGGLASSEQPTPWAQLAALFPALTAPGFDLALALKEEDFKFPRVGIQRTSIQSSGKRSYTGIVLG